MSNELEVIKTPKSSPKFISATDISAVVDIIVKADKISEEEAIHRLNRMVDKGTLIIVPPLGVKRDAK